MNNFNSDDTICALATGGGISAIALIRVSGNESIKIVDKIFSKNLKEQQSHTCLLYTSPSPRDAHESRMPSSA